MNNYINLSQVCEIVVPMRDKPKSFVNNEYGIPWCKIEDIEGKFLNNSKSQKYVSKDCIKEMHLRVFPKNTVICAVTGASIGTYAIVSQELVTNQTFAGLICNEKKLYYEYLYYYLKLYTKNLINNSVGCAQVYLTRETLENLKIPNIEYNEQIKTVKILKIIDDRINNNNRINNNLEDLALTIFLHKFGNKKPNGSIEQILYENSKSKVKVGDTKDVKGNYPFFTSGESILEWNDYFVDGRTLFLNTGGNADVKFYVGKAAYSTDTWAITTNNDMSDYLYLYLKSIKSNLDRKFFNGSGLKHLQKPLFKQEKIYIPSNEELLNFNEKVKSFFDIIASNKLENKKLTSLREWLLPMLMNGQINVDDMEI